ncbi:MAG: hypothetical protein ACLFRP_00510 [Puniceicoccaceae bacterium]
MGTSKTHLIALGLFGVCTSSGWGNIKPFNVDLDFELSATNTLTATLSNDIRLRFAEDVETDFVLVLRNAVDPVPTGGFTGETTPFSYERNGQEVLPTAGAVEMGYPAGSLEAIEPGDFFFEIGEVAFSAGDSFTIVGSAAESKTEWTGEFPTGSSSYSAFLTDANGDPVNGVEVIPEIRAAPLLFGFAALLALCVRRSRNIRSGRKP